MDDSRAFKLEEYRALRKEIDDHMEASRAEEHYAVIASGVTWAWLIAHHDPNGLLWAVPVLITAVILLRTWAISEHIIEIGQYLRSLETAFAAPGWEHAPKKRRVTSVRKGVAAVLFLLAAVAWADRKALAADPDSKPAQTRTAAPSASSSAGPT